MISCIFKLRTLKLPKKRTSFEKNLEIKFRELGFTMEIFLRKKGKNLCV